VAEIMPLVRVRLLHHPRHPPQVYLLLDNLLRVRDVGGLPLQVGVARLGGGVRTGWQSLVVQSQSQPQ
jgi:hypothetical protein